MLVSEEHIIEQVDIKEDELERDPPGVHLQYNHTNPQVISDGVNFVAVIKESANEYRIEYKGYAFGRMRITADGVAELGEWLATEDKQVPSWTVDPETVNSEDLPWWIPQETEIESTLTCDKCGSIVSVREVVTPHQLPPSLDGEVFCQHCWDAAHGGESH
jgi:hypothetical protein